MKLFQSYRTGDACRRLFFGMAVLAIAVSFSTSAQAQRGKITAKIIDATSGEPILHATLMIVETKQGAYSKEDGVATIINVDPGENYTVIAKYAEYNPDTIRRIKV